MIKETAGLGVAWSCFSFTFSLGKDEFGEFYLGGGFIS